MLDALLMEYGEKIRQKTNEDEKKIIYEALFLFSGMWAIGGAVGGGQDDEKDMKEFDKIWKGLAKNPKFPEQGNCIDYFYNIDDGKWQSWNDKREEYVSSEE